MHRFRRFIKGETILVSTNLFEDKWCMSKGYTYITTSALLRLKRDKKISATAYVHYVAASNENLSRVEENNYTPTPEECAAANGMTLINSKERRGDESFWFDWITGEIWMESAYQYDSDDRIAAITLDKSDAIRFGNELLAYAVRQ